MEHQLLSVLSSVFYAEFDVHYFGQLFWFQSYVFSFLGGFKGGNEIAPPKRKRLQVRWTDKVFFFHSVPTLVLCRPYTASILSPRKCLSWIKDIKFVVCPRFVGVSLCWLRQWTKIVVLPKCAMKRCVVQAENA